MCFIFSTILSETFLILRINKPDMIMNVHMSPCKVSIILVRLNLNFLDRFRKNTKKKSNSIQIRPVEAKLFHQDERANGRTDMRS